MRGYNEMLMGQASWTFLATLSSWCAAGGVLGYLGGLMWGPRGKYKR